MESMSSDTVYTNGNNDYASAFDIDSLYSAGYYDLSFGGYSTDSFPKNIAEINASYKILNKSNDTNSQIQRQNLNSLSDLSVVMPTNIQNETSLNKFNINCKISTNEFSQDNINQNCKKLSHQKKKSFIFSTPHLSLLSLTSTSKILPIKKNNLRVHSADGRLKKKYINLDKSRKRFSSNNCLTLTNTESFKLFLNNKKKFLPLQNSTSLLFTSNNNKNVFKNKNNNENKLNNLSKKMIIQISDSNIIKSLLDDIIKEIEK